MLAHIMLCDVVVVMRLDSELNLLGLLVVGLELFLSQCLLLKVSLLLSLLD